MWHLFAAIPMIAYWTIIERIGYLKIDYVTLYCVNLVEQTQVTKEG